MAALQSAELPLLLSLKVLRVAHEDAKEAGGLARLHSYCVQMLTANLAVPERAVDDWSIQPPADCVGELGEILAEFLESSTQRSKEWPLAQARRQAIRQIIHHNDLPVRYETRRKGRPYTLVLEKTNALFERAAAERRQWTHDLAWLRQMAASFTERAGG